ncbi:MAG: cohesin domain-containing protein [Patescibacteria group bacterium]
MFVLQSVLFSLIRNTLFLGAVVAVAFFVLGATTAKAADLSVSPASGTYNNGQTFTSTVRVLPSGDNVNAVEANLSFDTAVLQVVSVSRDGSVFSLWTTEPEFSNSAGTITFGGGSPTPFTADSTLVTVTWRAVGEGDGAVTFNSASVLAADGLGTDVFENASGATFTVGGAPIPTPDPTPTPTPEPEPEPDADNAAIAFGDPPRAPEIGSQEFLDPDTWYSTTDGIFSWTLPFDVNVVAVEIATSSENQPEENEDAVYDPPIEEFIINSDVVSDGVQYLSIKFRNQVGWGTVLNRKIQIDTTPPEDFEINVQAGTTASSFPLLTFEANDETSGIEVYEMTIADQEPFEITPDEARLGYLLGELEDGTYTVRVVASDKAGNETESSVPVLITAGWLPPQEVDEESSFWAFFSAVNILIMVLVLIIIMLIAFIWYEKKQNHLREEKLRKETREIQDQMEKIFSALRDEIYDQVNSITKRKRLSKGEKEAVEGLNQALEVSETLIEKEINDVKSILK